MTVVFPEGIPVLGNTSVRWVTTIADTAAPKLATELSAASPASMDVSCYLIADAWEVTQDVANGSAPRRLCQTSLFERFTTTTIKVKDLQYIIDPQAAAASAGKKAKETLTEGLKGYFVERQGKDADIAWAVGQFVNVLPVTLGHQLIMTPSDDNADYVVMQPIAVRGDLVQNVAIVT